MSKGPKPILHIFVRFCGAPSPRVRAAADSSSPILAIEIIRGTIRYSSIFRGLRKVVMPRIFIASRMAAYSSLTVGKNRNTTDCWVSVKQFSKNDTATACQDWLRSTRLGRGSIKSHVRTVKVLGMGLFAFQERIHLWKGVTH